MSILTSKQQSKANLKNKHIAKGFITGGVMSDKEVPDSTSYKENGQEEESITPQQENIAQQRKEHDRDFLRKLGNILSVLYRSVREDSGSRKKNAFIQKSLNQFILKEAAKTISDQILVLASRHFEDNERL